MYFSDDSTILIANNNQVNNVPEVRQPLAFQFGELGAGNLFSVPYFDISRITTSGIPPTLNPYDFGIQTTDGVPITGPSSYEDLLRDNPNTFSIKRSQTFTNKFVNNYPQYEDRINNLLELSLSADIDLVSYTYGQIFGFYFSGTRNRFLTLTANFNISYSYGVYKVNVCDPYTVMEPRLVDSPYGHSSIYSAMSYRINEEELNRHK